MKKIVINNDYGGFGISPLGIAKLAERKNLNVSFYKDIKDYSKDISKYNKDEYQKITDLSNADACTVHSINLHKDIVHEYPMSELNNVKRHDPDLVALVEEYGKLMNGFHASLDVVSIPEWFDYEIDEYDGAESVITVYNVTEEQLLQGLSKKEIELAKQANKICIVKHS
jgi:hypothetical protein